MTTSQTTEGSATAASPARSLVARLVGVVFAPRATYADVVQHPRWLGALLVVIVVSSATAATFSSTEVGRNAILDQQISQSEAYGRHLTDADIARMERIAPYFAYFGAAFPALTLPLGALLVSGLAFAVFNAAMGSDAKFKQTFAVVTHSGAILALQTLFSTPLAYARGTLSSATSLAVFAPFLDDDSFLARLLGGVDLFLLWWIISLAIGLAVLYRRRTGPVATTLIVVYVAIGVVVATVKTVLSGA
ncbi:MAG TPA: YIP1 family protein [Vicinamibacterales bacterium]|jgi:hypothetical protein